MVALMTLETSLRDGAALVFAPGLWIRSPNKLEGVLVVKLAGVRPSVAALWPFSGMPGEKEGPISSDGADKCRYVCGRLDFMYADTTDRSTLLPGFTLSPVSTSVSSAPIRASTLSRKGGMREGLLWREWLL